MHYDAEPRTCDGRSSNLWGVANDSARGAGACNVAVSEVQGPRAAEDLLHVVQSVVKCLEAEVLRASIITSLHTHTPQYMLTHTPMREACTTTLHNHTGNTHLRSTGGRGAYRCRRDTHFARLGSLGEPVTAHNQSAFALPRNCMHGTCACVGVCTYAPLCATTPLLAQAQFTAYVFPGCNPCAHAHTCVSHRYAWNTAAPQPPSPAHEGTPRIPLFGVPRPLRRRRTAVTANKCIHT